MKNYYLCIVALYRLHVVLSFIFFDLQMVAWWLLAAFQAVQNPLSIVTEQDFFSSPTLSGRRQLAEAYEVQLFSAESVSFLKLRFYNYFHFFINFFYRFVIFLLNVASMYYTHRPWIATLKDAVLSLRSPTHGLFVDKFEWCWFIFCFVVETCLVSTASFITESA